MKKLGWFTLCFCLMLVGGLVGSAQSRKPVAPQAKFSTVPFDVTAKQLPPKFLGHSLLDLWGLVNERKKALDQGEYETTKAWEERLERLNAKPLLGGVKLDSTLAFRVSDVENVYSADDEAITLTANTDKQAFDSMNEQGLSDFDSVLWWYDSKFIGSFIGSNAFGVKRRVRAETENYYHLLFNKGIIGRANTLTINEVSVEKAKAIRPLLRTLIVGTLIDPYIGGDKDETSATISDPVKTTTYNFYAYFEPTAFWFYNLETGEVYYRADLTAKAQAKQ